MELTTNKQTTDFSDWYIKECPKTLNDVFGHETVKKYITQKQRLRQFDKNTIFTGSFGTGKTVFAKILAKSIACKTPNTDGTPCDKCPTCMAINNETFDRDVMYVDCTNASADDIRNKVTMFRSSRAIHDAAKVMIVDEAQALSDQAIDVFLPAVQNPQKGVYFIFTAMAKLAGKKPGALQSRCKAWHLKSPSEVDVYNYLAFYAQSHHLTDDETVPESYWGDGLAFIAANADGSYRSAVQMLEQSYVGKIWDKKEMLEAFDLPDTEAATETLLHMACGVACDDVWAFLMGGKAVMDQLPLYASIIGDASIVKNYGTEGMPEGIEWKYDQAKRLAAAPYFYALEEAFDTLAKTAYVKQGTWKMELGKAWKKINASKAAPIVETTVPKRTGRRVIAEA